MLCTSGAGSRRWRPGGRGGLPPPLAPAPERAPLRARLPPAGHPGWAARLCCTYLRLPLLRAHPLQATLAGHDFAAERGHDAVVISTGAAVTPVDQARLQAERREAEERNRHRWAGWRGGRGGGVGGVAVGGRGGCSPGLGGPGWAGVAVSGGGGAQQAEVGAVLPGGSAAKGPSVAQGDAGR